MPKEYLKYHVNAIQTGRLVELYANEKEMKFGVKHYVNGRENFYPFTSMCDAYKQYNKLAAL